MELENMNIEELQKLLKEEQIKGKEIRNKMRVKMMKISTEMKRYGFTTPRTKPINYNENVKKQLIAQIQMQRTENAKLNKQWDQIKNLTGVDAMRAALIGFDNIDVSKQVEILRNLGYSESEIDIILSQISGDEDYDELKEKANDIMVNYYIKESGPAETVEPTADYQY